MKTTPRPLDGDVHIHCLTLPHLPAELAHLEKLLSPSEISRATLLKSDQARSRFIAGRGIVREILGGYVGIAAENVPIATGEHGKPYLADRGETLRFNLSHAEDLLIVAVATDIDVGVDIEKVAVDKALSDMARLAFSRHEQEVLLNLTSHQLKTEAFYRCWVRKEACMKACGKGFSLPGNSFDVSLLDGELPSQTVWCDQASWHVQDIDVPHNYSAALAVETRSSDPHLIYKSKF